VVAIGNALGQFQNTVTSGIISGYGRSITAGDSSGQGATENLINLFQTDAAINQGNSGGPLVNMNGQVIGINTAVAAGDAQNIGFAIPINDISGMINQVLETGKFARPYLGIRYVALSPDVAKQLDLSQTSGAYISESNDPSSPSIIPDSPADKAGLKQRDIITAIDDTKIDQTHSLSSLLGTHQPGDKVKLTIVRDGKTLHINATLGTLPAN
jgi:S1-C subfamily serine protease